jgi:hypothetical protein
VRAVAYATVGQPNRALRLWSSSISAHRSILSPAPVYIRSKEQFISLLRSHSMGGRLCFCGTITVFPFRIGFRWKGGGFAERGELPWPSTDLGGCVDSASSI